MQEQVKELQAKNKEVDDLRRVVEQLSRENTELKDAVSFELKYEEAMSEIAELKTELGETHMELSRMRKQLKRAQSESATLGPLNPHLDKKPRIH